jgi:hypothetical protein
MVSIVSVVELDPVALAHLNGEKAAIGNLFMEHRVTVSPTTPKPGHDNSLSFRLVSCN